MHSWLYMIGIRLSKCSSPLFLLLFILCFPLAHLLSQSGPPSLRAGLARDLACPLLSRGQARLAGGQAGRRKRVGWLRTSVCAAQLAGARG